MAKHAATQPAERSAHQDAWALYRELRNEAQSVRDFGMLPEEAIPTNVDSVNTVARITGINLATSHNHPTRQNEARHAR